MHEYSIVQALMAQVDEQARAHGAAAVHRVSLRIGELSGIEPDLLRSAFEMVALMRSAPTMLAPVRLAPFILVLNKCALFNSAPVKCEAIAV